MVVWWRASDGGSLVCAPPSCPSRRWAIQTVAILNFQALPRHMWPVTHAVMTNAGYCGLDQLEPPSKGADGYGQPGL